MRSVFSDTAEFGLKCDVRQIGHAVGQFLFLVRFPKNLTSLNRAPTRSLPSKTIRISTLFSDRDQTSARAYHPQGLPRNISDGDA